MGELEVFVVVWAIVAGFGCRSLDCPHRFARNNIEYSRTGSAGVD